EVVVAGAGTVGDWGVRDAFRGLLAELAIVAGRVEEACDKFLLNASTDSLNAPGTAFLAGMAALLATDANRVQRALTELRGLPGHSRMRAADRRMLEAGLAALDGRSMEAMRDARFALGEYEAIGLPWRHALSGLML